MQLLLDTHALLWVVNGETRLSRKARESIESYRNEIFVSAASVFEIATKVRLGKLPEAELLAAELPARLKILGFLELPITVDHAQRAGSLPGDHKDPFDRMLIAQAQAENMALVSNERIFDDWHVPRIW